MVSEIIKNFKLTKKDIKRKNTAAIITLVVEFIKVLTLLIFVGTLKTITLRILFSFSIVATILSILILFLDNYNKTFQYFILALASVIFTFSNIIGGILIELIIFKTDSKIAKELAKPKNYKKLPIKLHHKKIVYLYIFTSILIAYEGLRINDTLFYVLVFTSLIMFFKEDIIDSFKEFKTDVSKYFNYIINNYAIMLIVSNILFGIVGYIVGEVSTNEQILNQDILYSAILAIFYAPLAEELLFRGCLRKLIKKDILFILISGISFGAWHVIGYDQSLLQYLYIIPYSAMGIWLSYVYAKTNNLTTNVGIHAINNILATILPIIL